MDWGDLGREYFSKLSSPTGGVISWPAVLTAGLEMLERAKDLRVALVVAEALIRTDGVRGMGDGFDLLACLGTSFRENMFPKREKDRHAKLLQLEDFTLAWVKEQKSSILPTAYGDVEKATAKVKAAGSALAGPCAVDVVLARLARAMETLRVELQGQGGAAPEAAPSAAPAPAAATETAVTPSAPAAAPAANPAPVEAPTTAQVEQPKVETPPGAAAEPAPAAEAEPEKPPAVAVPEGSKYGPPGKYHTLGSTPISEAEPTGSKITNWGRLATEYFQKLSSPTAGAIDWNSVTSAALELLEQGKDLRVAFVATGALMRTGNLVGLANGLDLLGTLATTFGDDLHPKSPSDRQKKAVAFEAEAIAWFDEVKGQINLKGIAQLEIVIAKASFAMEGLTAICGGEPVFGRLRRTLTKRKEALEAEASSALAKVAASAPVAPPAPVAGSPAPAQTPTASKRPATPPGAVLPSKVESDRDAGRVLGEAKKLLRSVASYFTANKSDQPSTWRLERVTLWLQVLRVPPNDFLERPSEQIVERLETQSAKGEAPLEELVRLAKNYNFWLAGQRMLHAQLESENRKLEAAVVRAEATAIATSLPGLDKVTFKDGALVIDPITEAWLSAGSGAAAPVMKGPDVSGVVDKKEEKLRKKVRKEADKLASQERIPDAIAKYQIASQQASSGRDRFLWKLELASFCFVHSPAIARSLLSDLESEVAREGLGAWEPDLAIVVYTELLKLCPEEERARRDELFGKLVLIDPQKAARLQFPAVKIDPDRTGKSSSTASTADDSDES